MRTRGNRRRTVIVNKRLSKNVRETARVLQFPSCSVRNWQRWWFQRTNQKLKPCDQRRYWLLWRANQNALATSSITRKPSKYLATTWKSHEEQAKQILTNMTWVDYQTCAPTNSGKSKDETYCTTFWNWWPSSNGLAKTIVQKELYFSQRERTYGCLAPTQRG